MKIFESIKIQYEILEGNLVYKNPNKIICNYLTQINLSLDLTESVTGNLFVDVATNLLYIKDENAINTNFYNYNASKNEKNKYILSQNNLNSTNHYNTQKQTGKITVSGIRQDKEYFEESPNVNISETDIACNEKNHSQININTYPPTQTNYNNDQQTLLNESSSLLNLDHSFSLKDNKSIINIFNKNPINNINDSIQENSIYSIKGDMNNKNKLAYEKKKNFIFNNPNANNNLNQIFHNRNINDIRNNIGNKYNILKFQNNLFIQNNQLNPIIRKNSVNAFSCLIDNQNVNSLNGSGDIISLKDNDSIYSKSSYVLSDYKMRLNNFDLQNVDMNINSNIFKIRIESIFDSINIIFLNYLILERILDNCSRLENKSNDTEENTPLASKKLMELKKNFYFKFVKNIINKYYWGNISHSSNENGIFENFNLIFNPNNQNNNNDNASKEPAQTAKEFLFDNNNDSKANTLNNNDLYNITKLNLKNYLIYNHIGRNINNNIAQIIESLQVYVVLFLVDNHSVIDKIFEETLFLKLELMQNKIQNNFIFLKKLIEVILLFANLFELDDCSIDEKHYFSNKTQNKKPNTNFDSSNCFNKKEDNKAFHKLISSNLLDQVYVNKEISEIKLNMNLLYASLLKNFASDKIKDDNNFGIEKISNKKQTSNHSNNSSVNLMFNEASEVFFEKILFIMNVFRIKISRQIVLIKANLLKIKTQNFVRLYQIMFLYLLDAICLLFADSQQNSANVEMRNLFKEKSSELRNSILLYFEVFFNISVCDIDWNLDGVNKKLFKQVKYNFSAAIFFNKFEEKIKNILCLLQNLKLKEDLQSIHNSNNKGSLDMYNMNKADESLLSKAKQLKELINRGDINNNNYSSNFHEKNLDKQLFLMDYNQKNLINLIKKNSNII